MSTVPYVFANNTGNIPLSELDANFANVKASVDYATAAAQAVVAATASTVTSSAQPNIASVGTLTSLSVSGNVVGNYFIGNGSQLTGVISSYGNANVAVYLTGYTGNITCGILSASGNVIGNTVSGTNVSATANVAGGNILTAGLISATGNATAGNVLSIGLASIAGNVTGGNITTAGLVTATGNVTGGNITTAGLVTATGNVTGGNINTAGIASVGSLTATGNITSSGTISASGNVNGNAAFFLGNVTVAFGRMTAANIYCSGGNIDSGGNLNAEVIKSPGFYSYYQYPLAENTFPTAEFPPSTISYHRGFEQVQALYINVNANASYTLSETSSYTILTANNTGYTATVGFPGSIPVSDGTIVKFTVAGGNAITLVGDPRAPFYNFTYSPSFDGLTQPGTGYTYIYNLDSNTWYRTV